MKKNFSCAFTTMEAFIATTIIIILAASIFQVLYGSQPFFGIGEAKVQAQERTRLALTAMLRELKAVSSKHIYIRNFPAVSGSYEAAIDAVAGAYRGNSILFKLPVFYDMGERKIIKLDEKALLIFGAQDVSGDYQEDLTVEYCLIEIAQENRQELRRRVWQDADIDFDTLSISGIPVQERVLASNIKELIFHAFSSRHPVQLVLTVVGQSGESKGRQVSSYATSEVVFRN